MGEAAARGGVGGVNNSQVRNGRDDVGVRVLMG